MQSGERIDKDDATANRRADERAGVGVQKSRVLPINQSEHARAVL